ncbi:MAG: DUF5654 family protein [Anaerolineae bacterium]
MYKEVVDKIAQLVTTSFGLVAALAWNTAIQNWFDSAESLRSGGPLLYAIIVTIVAVLATVWVGRVSARLAGDEKLEEDAG